MKEILESPATLRVLLMMFIPLISTIPGITVDAATDLIVIDPHVAWPYLTAGLLGSFGIYAAWGKK